MRLNFLTITQAMKLGLCKIRAKAGRLCWKLMQRSRKIESGQILIYIKEKGRFSDELYFWGMSHDLKNRME
jgi:hypothetical protein